MAYKSASAWCPGVVARDRIQCWWQFHLAQPHQYVVHKVPGIEPVCFKRKLPCALNACLGQFAKPLTRSLNPEAEENRRQGQGWIWSSQRVGSLCSKTGTLVLTKLSAVVIVVFICVAVVIVSCDWFSCVHHYWMFSPNQVVDHPDFEGTVQTILANPSRVVMKLGWHYLIYA